MGLGSSTARLRRQEKALTAELPKLQAEVDALEIHQVSAEEVVAEATNLHRLWPTLASVDKRRIIESITEKIVITGEEIEIKLSYTPISEELTKRQRNVSGSSRPPA